MNKLTSTANRKKNVKRFVSLMVVLTIMTCFVAIGYCEGTTGTTPTLEIEFDTSQMFAWAQTIITAMMPVLYIIMGVGLGFIVIRAFKSAFN